jgi:hypothetical protein
MDAGVEATQERLPDVLSKSSALTHGLAGHECPASAKRGVVFSGLLLFYSGHPALRPSGQLRCSRTLLRAREQAKEK